jgi:hypothetical protein
MATIKIRDPVHNFIRFDEEKSETDQSRYPHGSLINRLGKDRCEQVARLLATGDLLRFPLSDVPGSRWRDPRQD